MYASMYNALRLVEFIFHPFALATLPAKQGCNLAHSFEGCLTQSLHVTTGTYYSTQVSRSKAGHATATVHVDLGKVAY